MLFAFSRDRAVPGHQAVAHRLPAPRAGLVGRRSLGSPASCCCCRPAGTTWRGLFRRHVRRHDRPLHRVHPPGDPALPARRQVRGRCVEPRQALQVDQPDRDRLGRASSSIVFMLPTVPAGHPGQRLPEVQLEPRQLRAADDRRRVRSCFGGWWMLSANKWFKGPVRMGSDDELAAARGEAGGRVQLPADTEYGKT